MRGNLREKLVRFMYGRYGVDRLSRHLMTAALVMSFLSMIPVLSFLFPIALALMVWGYARVFSRNNAKRYRELCGYEKLWGKVKGYPARLKSEIQQRKDYRIFKCPSCKQKLRIPKGRGQVEISCRKCRAVFRRRT